MSEKLDGLANDLVDLLNGETEKLKKKYNKDIIDELNEIVTGNPKELQKKYKNEALDKYVETFASSIPLWKLHDKQWMNERKEIWEKIVEREKQENRNFVTSYWDEAGRFFLKARPRKNDSKLYTYRRMAYTPFSSTKEIVDLYMRQHISLRRGLHEQLLSYASRTYRAVPEEFHRVRLIAEALYCKEYVARKEPMGHAKHLEFSVCCPRDFIIIYTNEARNYLERSCFNNLEKLKQVHNQHWHGHERSFSEVTIDYFIGNLEYAVNNCSEEYGGAINDIGIKGVIKICDLIEAYNPNVNDKNRDRYVEDAHNKIINNEAVNSIRKIPNN